MAVSSKMGKAKSKEQIARAKHDGNPGGERQEGRLVKHFDMATGSKHIARFQEKEGLLICSVCGLVL
jgi:hypothetical protein